MKRIFTIATLFIGFIFTSFTVVNPTIINGDTNNTIQFKKLTFENALKLAKKEHKKVFINVYATWCGPCKMMQAKTYNDAKVATYFNKHFININLDVEHNPEGMTIARKYGVHAHPCLLFINPDGSLAGKIMGYYQGAKLLEVLAQKVR